MGRKTCQEAGPWISSSGQSQPTIVYNAPGKDSHLSAHLPDIISELTYRGSLSFFVGRFCPYASMSQYLRNLRCSYRKQQNRHMLCMLHDIAGTIDSCINQCADINF